MSKLAASGRAHHSGSEAPPSGGYLASLTLAALGVVYGDIGTSPLYALRECFHSHSGLTPTPENVLGILSLILYALILNISIKYCLLILRADNNGEGGILSLMALSLRPSTLSPGQRTMLFSAGVFGAALFYGDGMITPAISVLSAVEGLEIATPVLKPYVIPITLAILVGLFGIQRKGTAGIGAVFGPITFLWFAVLAVLGLVKMVEVPAVLGALNPLYAVTFLAHNPWQGFVTLGSVVLVVTGGEALYADMGHFGKTPIRLAWFGLVLPALVLNYFGQGALLLQNPEAISNPFYNLAPSWALIPMVILAAMATCIASQAMISGAYSITRQAIQLGFCPRMEIVQTSSSEIGQIYIPTINSMLLGCVIVLVLGFKTSSSLAAAYGIAVTATMAINTFLAFFVVRNLWGWSMGKALVVLSPFLIIEVAFTASNLLKLAHGGWFPIVVGVLVFLILTTWKKGRELLSAKLNEAQVPMDLFVESLSLSPPPVVPGTAVFLVGNPNGVPHALLHNLKHNRILHERVVFLTVINEEVPFIPEAQRLHYEQFDTRFSRLVLRYGFMESPAVGKQLDNLNIPELKLEPMSTSYFLGRESLIVSHKAGGMARWRKGLFVWMAQNARRASDFFSLPPNRVVEMGTQLEI